MPIQIFCPRYVYGHLSLVQAWPCSNIHLSAQSCAMLANRSSHFWNTIIFMGSMTNDIPYILPHVLTITSIFAGGGITIARSSLCLARIFTHSSGEKSVSLPMTIAMAKQTKHTHRSISLYPLQSPHCVLFLTIVPILVTRRSLNVSI